MFDMVGKQEDATEPTQITYKYVMQLIPLTGSYLFIDLVLMRQS